MSLIRKLSLAVNSALCFAFFVCFRPRAHPQRHTRALVWQIETLQSSTIYLLCGDGTRLYLREVSELSALRDYMKSPEIIKIDKPCLNRNIGFGIVGIPQSFVSINI